MGHSFEAGKCLVIYNEYNIYLKQKTYWKAHDIKSILDNLVSYHCSFTTFVLDIDFLEVSIAKDHKLSGLK